MDKSKKIKQSQVNPLIETRNLEQMAKGTGNVYESIVTVFKRANQISADLKSELHTKLEDFASHSDSLEEIQENREQIEISRFYEKLPHPTLLAFNEYSTGQLDSRYPEEAPVEGKN